MTRRELLALAAALGLPPAAAAQNAAAHRALKDPAAIAAADGELVYVGRDPVRIKISPQAGTARVAMITQEVSPGTAIPVHLHEREDEIIFIQSGEGTATVGDRSVALAPGSTLFVPQGTWHGGRNTGAGTLMWIAIYSPSGFEGYFREIGRASPAAPPLSRTPEERQRLDERFGIKYRG
jgi:mannose-6-phosphate isomerase-like protein (cupin superfamily)